MTNINSIAWNYIDGRTEVKKTLLAGLINASALARKIAEEENLGHSTDAIISAIRRYEGSREKTASYKRIYGLFAKARVSAKTRLASLLVRKSDETRRKLESIYSRASLRRDSTVRIFEVTNYIKIIAEEENIEQIRDMFGRNDIESMEKDIGEITINYNDDITKIPGVFAWVSNEMALNDISIIDSMICHREHIILMDEESLEKALKIMLNLAKAHRKKHALESR